jgi:hypothetical protein
MKKVLIALVSVAVLAFGAGSTSALELEPVSTTSITSDPGGGGR